MTTNGGMESLFQSVFEPNPRAVSHDAGVIVHSTEPSITRVTSPGPVRIVVSRIWVDEDGTTYAEGEIEETDDPPEPLSLPWSDPRSDPIADLNAMQAKMYALGARGTGKVLMMEAATEEYNKRVAEATQDDLPLVPIETDRPPPNRAGRRGTKRHKGEWKRG